CSYSSPLVRLLFSSYLHVSPSALHSFPTRRSSDLLIWSSTVATSSPPAPGTHTSKKWWWVESCWSMSPRNAAGFTDFSRMERSRSEEHTSELQSRFDLVCRLLLEKKKTHRELILIL